LDAGLADQRRVLRGGSFINNQRNARCAVRNDNDNLNNNVGFRVVASYFSPNFGKDPKGFRNHLGLYASNALRSRT
jgi:hypothetical protein